MDGDTNNDIVFLELITDIATVVHNYFLWSLIARKHRLGTVQEEKENIKNTLMARYNYPNSEVFENIFDLTIQIFDSEE